MWPPLRSRVDGLYWFMSLHFPRSSLQNLIIGFYAFLVLPTRQEKPLRGQGEVGRDQGIELGSRDPRPSALGWAGSLQPTAGVGRILWLWACISGSAQPRPTRSCERPLAGRERHCLKPQAGGGVEGVGGSLGLGARPGTWKMTWWGPRA